jgi:hypothetical protein
VTFIGKILTGLTLVLSIMFASLAVVVYATHQNWREQAQKLQTNLGALKAANQRLREDIDTNKDQYAREQAARRFEVAALETQLSQANDQLVEAVKESDRLAAQIGVLVQTNSTTTAQLDSLTAEVGTLRSGLKLAENDRDQQFQTAVDLTDQNHALQGTRDNLQERGNQLAAQLSRFRAIMDARGISEFEDVSDVPPRLEGVVVAVNKDLIEISVGSDEGLKVGHALDVYRGNTYLGRVVVRKAMPDRSVTQIIPDYSKGLIKTGDHVATRFID